jgi:hypothetical protein
MADTAFEICDLSQHPEYARRVGEIVSLWSMIELRLSISATARERIDRLRRAPA